MEVVPGVTQIAFPYVNAFLVEGSELTLVDSGTPRAARKVRQALDAAGGADRLRNVLVTHHHVDHVGPLAALAGDAVTVWAHPLDARVVRGEVPPPKPASRSGLERAGVKFIERVAPKFTPARVDREVADGEHIPIGEGFVAHHTPGHTAGHLSFLYPARRILFVGDAAANYLGRLGPPFGLYSEDHAAVRASIARIAAMDFDVACFGHGRVLKGAANAKFRTLAERLAG